MSRAELPTERPNERAEGLDAMTTREALDVFHEEDASIAQAIHAARDSIAAAIDLIAERLQGGGRLFYVGAGTSGRLGVLDAVECPPTFRSDPAQVRGLIAGGPEALLRSVEGAEDEREGGAAMLTANEVNGNDVVFGIAAGGTTPFVHGAIAHAKELGAATVFFACVPEDQVPDEADVSIRVVTGPEVLAGSTRMKAGTATKMVLNRVSTLVMVRLGKTYGNRMVDVNAGSNAKLWERGTNLVREICGVDEAVAADLLERASGRVKIAAVLHAFGLDDPADAERRLEAAGGFLGRALADAGGTAGESQESR